MNPLPQNIQDQISEMPECSYGANKVTLILDDGTSYDDVYVAWGKDVVKVGNSENIPFDPSRVVKVEDDS